MISNLNIRHTYLNIKINNQGKTLHVWSLTTESSKGSHQYTENSNLIFSSKNDTFRIWRPLWVCNLNIRHTYLNIKINNQGKTLHIWSLTTESNKGSHQYTENSNLSFSSKNDTFTIWRSCKNIRHTYLNIKINNQEKTLHVISDHWEQQRKPPVY